MAEYLTDLFALGGKVVLLTGGGGLLCGEMARGLARAGARVVVLDVRGEKAESVVAEIRASGGDATAETLDVTDASAWDAVVRRVRASHGRIDGLVNGAGCNAPMKALDVTLDEWRKIFSVNVEGTLLGCQAVGRVMIEQRRGAILNVSSASAAPPLSKAFAYSASKASVRSVTQSLAREWAREGVRVNALRPGFFPTAWSRTHFIDAAREQAIHAHTAMGRYGEAHELVGATLWLLSDAASFVTGAEIAVDGGFSAMTI